MVIPIADRHVPYAESVRDELLGRGFRAEVDARNERMNLKIREAQIQKVPYMMVVGDREAEQNTASIRVRDGENLGALSTSDVIKLLDDETSPFR